MMGGEKEIEEMAEAIFQNCNCGLFFSEAEKIARFVIEEQGYRKQSEVEELKESIEYGNEVCKNCQNNKDKGLKQAKKKVAREIIGEILLNHTPDIDGFFTMHESELAKIKNKYAGEKEDEQIH